MTRAASRRRALTASTIPAVTVSAHDSLVLLALLVAGDGAARARARSCASRTRSCSCWAVSASASSRASPHISLQPEIVLVGFLPPLLYSGAFFTSLRDLRTQRAGDLAARGGSRARDDADGGRRLPRGHRRALVAGLLRDRRDRRAHRRGRGNRDRLAAGPAAPARDADRGREPDQRRDGARRLQLRRRGRRHGELLALACDLALRGGRGRGRCDRARRRLRAAPVPAPARPLADGDRDRAALGLLRLPARAGRRRLRRARRGHRGHLRGLVHARADDRADATAGRRRLGDPHLPAQRAALRPRRAAAAPDPRLAARALDRLAARRRRDRERGRDRHAPDLGLPRHLHPEMAVEAHPRARPLSALAVPDADRLGRPPRSRLAGRGARAAAHDRRRRALPAALVRDLPGVLRDPRPRSSCRDSRSRP